MQVHWRRARPSRIATFLAARFSVMVRRQAAR
jgi:hypothetical protein